MAKSEPKNTTSNKFKRLIILSVATVIGLGLNALLFLGMQNDQEVKLNQSLEFGVAQRMSAIERSIENKELTIMALQNHLSSVTTREDFSAFTAPFLKQVTGIQALEWVPRVQASKRSQFVQEALNDKIKGFDIITIDNQGNPVTAPQKEEYYPVYFVEPFQGNESVLGFDLSSNPVLYKTLMESITSGQPRSTGLISLIPGQEQTKGIHTVFPIYEQQNANLTESQRMETFRGFALGVFNAADLIDEPIETFENDRIDIYVTDVTVPNRPQNIHYHNPSMDDDTFDANYYTQVPESLHKIQILKIGSRTWQLTFVPTPEFVQSNKSNFPAIVAVIGLILLALVIAYYNLTLNRTRIIKNQVHEKTKELERSQAEAVQSSQIAKEANKSKSEFLTNISHELRTPLNGVLGISNTLIKNQTANLSDSQLRGLNMIQRSGLRILDLINDILDLEKLESGNTIFKARPVRIPGLFDYVEHVFKSQMEARIAHRESPLDLYIECGSEVPEFILSDRRMLEQILKNLLTYAIAFTSKGSIRFKLHVIESSIWLEITDSNPNLPDAELDNIFNKFHKRAGASKAYQDSGLGLSMSKSLVHIMGGKIKATKEDQIGTKLSMSFLFRANENEVIEPFVKHISKDQYQPIGQVKSPDQLHSSLAKLKQALSQSTDTSQPGHLSLDLSDVSIKEDHKVLNNKTIFICSSNDDNRKNLLQALNTFDIDIIEANSATNAIEQLEDKHVDLVVIDENLSDSSVASLIDIFQILRADASMGYLILSNTLEFSYNDDLALEVLKMPFNGTGYLDALSGLIQTKNKTKQNENRKHILIADDETVGRELLRMILEKEHILSYAKNGKEAVQIYFENKPDLVLMDIMMPEMDGIEALKQIKEKDPQHTPVIALTAKASKDEEEELLTNGFNGYISKPYKADKLSETIQAFF